jgi:hypothetical protein
MGIRLTARVTASRGAPPPDRLRHFQRTTFEIAYLTAGSLGVAWAERMQLLPRAFPPWRGILAGVAAYAVAVLALRPRWHRAVERKSRVVHLFMPSNGKERA